MATEGDQILAALDDLKAVASYSPPLKLHGPNLVAVAATGAGPAVYTADKDYVLWVVRASAVTTGGTVLIQGCEKDSASAADWYTIGTIAYTANGTGSVVIFDESHVYMRSNLTARTDGTVNTVMLYKDAVGLQVS
jgi:hypothetical protein